MLVGLNVSWTVSSILLGSVCALFSQQREEQAAADDVVNFQAASNQAAAYDTRSQLVCFKPMLALSVQVRVSPYIPQHGLTLALDGSPRTTLSMQTHHR